MPLVREYRLVLPMTVEEYDKGRHWYEVKNLKLDLKEAKEDPVDFQKNGKKTFVREEVTGIPFAGKLIPDIRAEHKIEKKGPVVIAWNEDPQPFMKTIRFIEALVGLCIFEKLKLTEFEAWDAFPYYRSVCRTRDQALLGKSHEVIMEVLCLPGNGQLDNALNLPQSILDHRYVHYIDIAKNVADVDYDSEKDPVLFHSTKTGRGSLKPEKWIGSTGIPLHLMTCYILVTVNFTRWGLSHVAERKLQNKVLRSITMSHREIFCGIDNWIDVPLADLVTEERELREELERVIKEPAKFGKQIKGDGDVRLDIGRGEAAERDPNAACSLGMGASLIMSAFVLLGLFFVFIREI